MLRTIVMPVLLVLSVGCTMGLREEAVHRMGEQATVGPVVYNVLETEWRNQLGNPLDPMIPKNKFLLVRLSIRNAGNQQVAVPLLNLVEVLDEDTPRSEGKTYLELSDVKGVPNWLGLLRLLEGADFVEGTIVFDVPAADYYLRITDGGALEDERTALILLPLTLDTPGLEAPTPTPGADL